MARGRHAAKHRASHSLVATRPLVAVFAIACAVAAVTLAVLATDLRLLRLAVAAGLAAALAPAALSLRSARPQAANHDEWRALRLELAELRGELDAYVATALAAAAHEQASEPVRPEQRAVLTLPLVRAAFAAVPAPANGNGNGHLPHPNGNGNGHLPHTIDLTHERAASQ